MVLEEALGSSGTASRICNDFQNQCSVLFSSVLCLTQLDLIGFAEAFFKEGITTHMLRVWQCCIVLHHNCMRLQVHSGIRWVFPRGRHNLGSLAWPPKFWFHEQVQQDGVRHDSNVCLAGFLLPIPGENPIPGKASCSAGTADRSCKSKACVMMCLWQRRSTWFCTFAQDDLIQRVKQELDQSDI